MSWLFSQALVEAYLEENSSAGVLSAQLSLMPTPHAFLHNGRTMDCSTLSQFGLTSRLLTVDRGEDVLTWYLEAFPVKTYPQQEKEWESKAIEADFGWKWRESSVKYDPDMRLWKTRQCSLLEDSEWFLATWPQWGLMRDGECWELPMSARPIFANGSGLLPTIRASDAERGGQGDLIQAVRGNSNKHFATVLPTPTANAYGSCQGGSAGRDGQPNRPSLQTMAKKDLWPTPHGFSKDGRTNGPSGNELGRAVNQMWGTPKAQDSRHAKTDRGKSNLGEQVAEQHNGGSLNPTWVEWLMGWPRNWTSLKPMARCVMRLWDREPADVARVANGVDARVDRLKAIGNGQVPQCASEAWKILSESAED